MILFERIFIHCDGWRTCMDVLLPHNSCRPLSLTALTKANSLDWNKKGNWWSICGGIVMVLHCTCTYQQFVDVRYRQGHNVLIGEEESSSTLMFPDYFTLLENNTKISYRLEVALCWQCCPKQRCSMKIWFPWEGTINHCGQRFPFSLLSKSKLDHAQWRSSYYKKQNSIRVARNTS